MTHRAGGALRGSGSLACTVRLHSKTPSQTNKAKTDVDDKIGLARNKLEETTGSAEN